VIFAVYAVGVMAGLLLFGGLSDQIGRRPVLLPGLALSAASAVVFVFTNPQGGGVPLLLVGRVLSGLSAGIFTGTATATLIDFAAFAVAGMFGAVTPAFLGQLLHVTNRAIVGVVVFGLTAGIVTTSIASTRVAGRWAMLAGCAGLFAAMGILAASLATRSLPLL